MNGIWRPDGLSRNGNSLPGPQRSEEPRASVHGGTEDEPGF